MMWKSEDQIMEVIRELAKDEKRFCLSLTGLQNVVASDQILYVGKTVRLQRAAHMENL